MRQNRPGRFTLISARFSAVSLASLPCPAICLKAHDKPMPMNRETFGPREWSFGWEYLMGARADGSACETAAPQFDGRARVVIEGVRPEIDGGQFPIKRVIGEYVAVEADVFADGHEWISCEILYREEGEPRWRSKPMRSIGNDRWRADFQVTELGLYRYSLQGWIDPFKTWRDD